MSGCPFNRRKFLGAGAAAAAGLAATGSAGKWLRLRVVYAAMGVVQDKPDWPNVGFDFAPVMERMNATLTNALPEFEFLPVMAGGAAQAEKIVLRDALERIDGYIVVQMNNWMLALYPLVATGKPVLMVDFKYGGTGGFLAFSSLMQRLKAGNVGLVSSPVPDDLIAAVRCFSEAVPGRARDFAELTARVRRERTPGPGDLSCTADPVATVPAEQCIARLKESKILAVGYPGVSLFAIPRIGMKRISFGELNDHWEAADPDESRAVAERWKLGAESIEDVSDETLVSSAAMYLGMKRMLDKHKANAVTVNCLAGFYGNRISAYPCLGFHELLNEGLIGACECDVRSAGTMIAMTALTGGRPGYISDPVLDTSQRRIIYAHCVASNRPFGPEGPANAYQILTHSEDRKGASVRSLLPAGYMTTSVEFAPERREVLVHTAKAVDNDPDDRACRTKLVAEPVGDFEKLFTHWDQWSWHRVTVYGDLVEPVRELAAVMKYKVVMEA